jgi:hypothetical protein
MDGKINLWNKASLSREHELIDIVKGGILRCISIGNKLIIAGDDLTVKIIDKEK